MKNSILKNDPLKYFKSQIRRKELKRNFTNFFDNETYGEPEISNNIYCNKEEGWIYFKHPINNFSANKKYYFINSLEDVLIKENLNAMDSYINIIMMQESNGNRSLYFDQINSQISGLESNVKIIITDINKRIKKNKEAIETDKLSLKPVSNTPIETVTKVSNDLNNKTIEEPYEVELKSNPDLILDTENLKVITIIEKNERYIAEDTILVNAYSLINSSINELKKEISKYPIISKEENEKIRWEKDMESFFIIFAGLIKAGYLKMPNKSNSTGNFGEILNKTFYVKQIDSEQEFTESALIQNLQPSKSKAMANKTATSDPMKEIIENFRIYINSK